LINFKFTQALLKDMNVQANAANTTDVISDDFYCWHVNLVKINNRKHIIFVNDLSRLCVLVDGVRSGQLNSLKEKFFSTLSTYLIREDVGPDLVNKYLQAGTEIMISKTDNRSVLGTMKEMTLYADGTHLDFSDNVERSKWLNRLIYKPIDYNEPNTVFKEALRVRL